MSSSIDNGGGKAVQWQKIMVVAEPTRESAAALHYVLSRKHSSSTAIKTSTTETHGFHGGVCGCIGGDIDFLDQMKSACKVVHPRLKVNVSRVETDAKDKAYMIMSQTKAHGIDLLVVGKRQSLANAILG
ncbi:uncharacterized protein LOC143560861 [Bidens hawaiensis]|uniref:uncharacterized protein LOC143560861 n=1 Tax=Bidens hawaiensis TaxID=980011 RepID=UPI00404B2958